MYSYLCKTEKGKAVNTFPTSTEEQRDDLKDRLQTTVVDWLEHHKMANGSVAGAFSLYDAVDDAVDSEFEKVAGRSSRIGSVRS